VKTLDIVFPEHLFLRHVDKQEFHWIWTGAVGGSSNTYGVFTVVVDAEKQTKMAHVWSYLFYVGPIPDEYEVDHVCKVRLCVRPHPEHLEAVTHAENSERKRLKVCKNGHELNEENVYRKADGRIHGCKLCRREAFLRWKEGR
jgi:hypothetical protein